MESRRIFRFLPAAAACIFFMAAASGFAQAATRPSVKSHKVKVVGPIVVHDGDVLQIRSGKDGSAYSFKVTDRTTIRCDKGLLHRSTVMDATALVPALTVEIEGVSYPEDMPEARTIKFSPDTFAPAQSGDSCGQVVHDLGRSHGVRTLLSSLSPM